eukprot:12491183-Alexandrium_andersonii.AAC.1
MHVLKAGDWAKARNCRCCRCKKEARSANPHDYGRMQPRSWFADVCAVTKLQELPGKPSAAERLRRWKLARAEAARKEGSATEMAALRSGGSGDAAR